MDEQESLLLGRTFQSGAPATGRGAADAGAPSPVRVPTGGDVFAADGESHLITIAPPGSDKARAVVVPNLLTYPGPVVVVDPTGEYYAATHRARRDMGHAVVRLDPFHVVDQESDALNPLDLVSLTGADVETDCQDVAELVAPRASIHDVWEGSAFGLLCGVVGYVVSVPEKRTITGLVTTFTSDDVVYNLAVVLDTVGKRLPATAFAEIAAFVQKPEADRARILATITSRNAALSGAEVLKTLDRSTVPLADVVDGKPLSAYLVIPPAKLRSHVPVLRLWVGTLLHCLAGRAGPPAAPARPTLVLLDECGRLGHFPAVESAVTLSRGRGFRVWTVWQDWSQVRGLYPAGWPTLVGSCGVVQVLGATDYAAAAETAAILGVEPTDALTLGADEQLVRAGGVVHKVKKLDYLTDPLFAGRFDDNP